MIGIIDYGMGNLRSVQKGFESVGAQAIVLSSPEQISGVSHLVLPGVGAFADAMQQLEQRGWIEPIKQFAASGKPLLGVCLGLQLLFDGSEEDAPSPDQPVTGLGLLPGQVVRFDVDKPEKGRLKVPHMGWNAIQWKREDPLMQGIEQGAYVYFVHSYYAKPDPQSADTVVSATADYGGAFCASVWRDNIWATQFHPEKSQQVGLRMLKNFAQLS